MRRAGHRMGRRLATPIARGQIARGLLATVSVICAGLLAGCLTFDADDWPLVERVIDEQYPDVEQITTSELAARLGADTAPLLIDVREPAEYAVSHLPGAQRATTIAEAHHLLASRVDGQTVVLYCSVGYRSSRLTQALQEHGVTDVVNLAGSIFTWANEGRPLVDAEGKPTTKVHPYGRRWQKLLADSLRATP